MAHHDSQQLPFELVALEAALKEVVNAAGMQVWLGGLLRRWPPRLEKRPAQQR